MRAGTIQDDKYRVVLPAQNFSSFLGHTSIELLFSSREPESVIVNEHLC